MDHRELISACFPRCTSRSLLVAELGMESLDLADGNWENRATFLPTLKKLKARGHTTNSISEKINSVLDDGAPGGAGELYCMVLRELRYHWDRLTWADL